MIFFNYKNQPIGELKDGVYTKKVNPKKHYMRIYQGYGISQAVMKNLIANGCKFIQINTGDNLYAISVEEFMSHSIKANYADPQVFCPLKWFTSKNGKQKEML